MGRFESFRRAADAPVVPGPERVEVATPDCSACGAGDRNGVLRTRQVAEGVELVLCLDYFACAERYRAGLDAATYAMGLRGELLAVAL